MSKEDGVDHLSCDVLVLGAHESIIYIAQTPYVAYSLN